ncbi:acyl-CoA N-acyltransferase [Delphinella strobiligena]|nr:acyl-CoA N-acyltransferase [Delphinella strobiligena]
MSLASPTGNVRDEAPKGPNVLNVVLGNLLIKPWYPSFYPEDLVGKVVDRLYICAACFRYSKELMPYLAHMVCIKHSALILLNTKLMQKGKKVCPQKELPPPGTLIYRTKDHMIYEVDGEEHKLYCQNLSLFAKLFLDTKSVFYDVTTFRYYLLVLSDPANPAAQVIGFFSKEKMSWDNNNVACILIFPPWQRRGLGQILMGVSYELSKREGRLGGPEKPLSALGRRAYLAYWSAAICRSILATDSQELAITKIVQDTWIEAGDVIAALKDMTVVEPGGEPESKVMLIRDKLKIWAEAHAAPLVSPVDVHAFREAPEYSESGDPIYAKNS